MMPIIRTTPEGVMIEGELTVDVIPSFIAAGYALIDEAKGSLTWDLSKVVRVDSASLALLIDWMRYAKRQQKVLHFVHLPEKMLQIMKLSNLEL